MELEIRASKKIDNAEEAGEDIKSVSQSDTAQVAEPLHTIAALKDIREIDAADLSVKESDVTTAEDTILSKDKPAHSEVNTLSLTISPSVSQVVHVCASHKKPRLLIRFITTVREQEKLHKVRQPGAMIIFATKIKSVKFVVDLLQRQTISSEPLHGQLPQSQRERALSEFKAVRS